VNSLLVTMINVNIRLGILVTAKRLLGALETVNSLLETLVT